MKTEYFYIYNRQEALFFIRNGAFLVDIGIGGKGDVYHQFPRDEKHEEIFMKWKQEKYGDKAI